MSESLPALFRCFPALAARIPHRPILDGPTPVGPLGLPGVADGQVWIKRDESCCDLYGGNKPRKLEFSLAQAQRRRSRRVLTTGGLGTHHGLATTILAGEAGLATTVVLVDQPVTPDVRRSLLLMLSYGADLVHGATLSGAALATAQSLVLSALRGERPLLLPTGGSSSLGCLGFVSGGLELAEQVKAGKLPEPAAIFVAVGSGGTLAGLALGLRLAGLATRVVGVLVTDILPPNAARLARKARRIHQTLRRHDPDIPRVDLSPADFQLTESQLGAGYGATTPAADEAVRIAREIGLEAETTYTGKCLAEILARARKGSLPNGPVLFWNTKNSVDVAARAPRQARVEELPISIQRLLAAR